MSAIVNLLFIQMKKKEKTKKKKKKRDITLVQLQKIEDIIN